MHIVFTSFLFFIILVAPLSAFAAMVINEIAWMGRPGAATDEWVELKNTGAAVVDLSGWTLSGTAGSNPLYISLSGSIAPGAHFLLERTDDTSVPGITADLIYTGALSNAGDTLTLKNAAGTIIDTVTGGENWAAIGGESATGHTPQRSGNTWITAAPTPKAGNASGPPAAPPPSPTHDANADEGTPSTETASSGSVGGAPLPSLTADAGSDRTVIVGADTVFQGTAYGLAGEPLSGARYLWNFGDGGTAEGRRVLHRYSYPSEYVVVLSVASGEYSVSDRFTVTARPAALALVYADGERIEIQNNAAHEIDLGRWYLATTDATFSFPEQTIIPSGKRLILSAETTGITHVFGLSLHYPNGEVALTYTKVGIIADGIAMSAPPEEPEHIAPSAAPLIIYRERAVPEIPPATTPEATSTNAAADSLHVAAVAESSQPLWPWLLALFTLFAASSAAVLLRRISGDEDSYEISET